MNDRIPITTKADCDELLSIYSIEEIRMLMEREAFETSGIFVEYLVKRIMGTEKKG